ncbi:MAG: histidine kinase [Bryobacteraceae bacterium]
MVTALPNRQSSGPIRFAHVAARVWSGARPYVTLLAFNVAIAGTLTLIFVWTGRNPSWAALRSAFVPNFILSSAIGFSCALVLPRFVPAVWPLHPVLRWTAIVAALLAINFAGVCVGVASLLWIYRPNTGFWPNVWSIYRTAAVVTLLIGIFATLYESWRRRIEEANLEIKNKEIQRERAQKLAASAQLASIESRIHPHFLFNALNSISALIREDPVRAEELVERLSRLLRSSLDTHQESLIPLDREIKLVRDYLAIQAARFGPRLRYRIDAGDFSDATIPPFAIQTLVENSIKYAVAARPAGGEIAVGARREQGRLVVEVSDDGPGFDAASIQPGHGLDTLRARLEALFGDASLAIVPSSSGVCVRIAIPQHSHREAPR